jgi:hypothetical protein
VVSRPRVQVVAKSGRRVVKILEGRVFRRNLGEELLAGLVAGIQNIERDRTQPCTGSNRAFDRRRVAAVILGDAIARHVFRDRRDHLLIGFR